MNAATYLAATDCPEPDRLYRHHCLVVHFLPRARLMCIRIELALLVHKHRQVVVPGYGEPNRSSWPAASSHRGSLRRAALAGVEAGASSAAGATAAGPDTKIRKIEVVAGLLLR